jgi:RNA polymerase sigma-70 factor, ECF subfamily
MLVRYAQKLTRNRDRAEDLAQDTILRALAKAHLYSEKGRFESWLLVILHRSFVNGIRRGARAGVTTSLDAADLEGGRMGQQETSLIIGDIERCFSLLPVEWAQATLLIGREGYSYDEVAKLLNLPAGTVRSRASRARALLRRLVDGNTADIAA